VFCELLAFNSFCKALDFTASESTGINYSWEQEFPGSWQHVLDTMSALPGVPPAFSPSARSSVPRSLWDIGRPAFLPKWKAPGLKWRLIIDKHRAPCSGLHSVIARVIDAALDNLPVEMWSDYNSLMDLLPCVADFNDHVASLFSDPVFTIEAEDMADCYHHLPCNRAPAIWDDVCSFWMKRGVAHISVPTGRGRGRGRLGVHDLPGWLVVPLCIVSAVLSHFASTNFVRMPGWIGRELKGAPMGDSLSGAILRLFKWQREQFCWANEAIDTVCIPGSRCKQVRLHDCCVLALDVSFRDDLRIFCAWDRVTGLPVTTVQEWARERLHMRFQIGSMRLDPSVPADLFTGLHTLWQNGTLVVYPKLSDPWAAAVYNQVDNAPLKPWCSWAPPQQRLAILRALLCRAWYFSSCPSVRRIAFWEALISLTLRADFPFTFVHSKSLEWARTWHPKGQCAPSTACLRDLQAALSDASSALHHIRS
jgi:hypothetical protein